MIDRGITIRANSEEASIFVTTGSAITINAPANQGVAIQGLTLRGGPSAENGILVNSVGHLGVYSLRAGTFQAAAPNGFGIKIAVSNQARFIFQNLSLNGNGNATNLTGGAIQIGPQPGGSALVTMTRHREPQRFRHRGRRKLKRRRHEYNGTEHRIYPQQSGRHYRRHADWGRAYRRHGGTQHALEQSVRRGAFGPGVTIRLNGNTISGNNTGVAAGSGGAVLSYGNNAINANGADGTPGTVALK